MPKGVYDRSEINKKRIAEKCATAEEAIAEAASGEIKPVPPKNKNCRPGGAGVYLTAGESDVMMQYVQTASPFLKLKRVDMTNVDEVRKRLNMFWDIHINSGVRPTVTRMALALGVDRREVSNYIHNNVQRHDGTGYMGNAPKEVRELLQTHYQMLEAVYEDWMIDNKVNPVVGIFLSKNHFNYQDRTDYVVTPNVADESEYSAEDIRKRYLPDGE